MGYYQRHMARLVVDIARGENTTTLNVENVRAYLVELFDSPHWQEAYEFGVAISDEIALWPEEQRIDLLKRTDRVVDELTQLPNLDEYRRWYRG